MCACILRAVANGPVGPAMAGPIIEPLIFFNFFLFMLLYNFFPAGPITEPVILIFAFFVGGDKLLRSGANEQECNGVGIHYPMN